MAGLVIAQCVTRSIRIEERAIDREGRLHTFGRSRNDELHAAAGIPRGIDAGDVRCGVFPALNTIRPEAESEVPPHAGMAVNCIDRRCPRAVTF